MTPLLILAVVVTFALAFANGANDNAKGVATLIGSGTLSTRTAVTYAAITTMLGSVAAIFLATALLAKFGGKGIVDDEMVASAAFPVSVGLGAAATVLLATFVGLPISTTHALVGSIIGIGTAAGGLSWAGVWTSFLMPLLVSPFAALAVAYLLYLLFRWTRIRLGVTSVTCLCAGPKPVPLTVNHDGSFSVTATGLAVEAGDVDQCRERYDGKVVGVSAQRILDACHFVTAGAVSFARGLNDTPKVAAIMVVAGAAAGAAGGIDSQVALVATGVGIALGGLLAVRRVARTMSHRITGMNDGQAFTANLVTAFMVIVASRLGMPVSTTHVSCGSLFGIGAASRRGRWKMIATIVGAWVVTLPVAAVLAGLAWTMLG